MSDYMSPKQNDDFHLSNESRITKRDGQIVVIHRKTRYEAQGQMENMLLDVEHKHARKMSYRWLIFNAILQVLCLLGITFIVFLFPLVVYIND